MVGCLVVEVAASFAVTGRQRSKPFRKHRDRRVPDKLGDASTVELLVLEAAIHLRARERFFERVVGSLLD